MTFDVLLTDDAVSDLEELYDYLSLHDSHEKADHVLAGIERAIDGLVSFPDRGSFPPELRDIDIREYREVFFKPYRIIYRTAAKAVYVLLVADGRRDMQNLLQKRLLR